MNPSPESQSLWYYADAANQPVGPLPFSDLQQLAAAGVIQPETHVIEKGGAEWKKFASVILPLARAVTKPASADIPLSSATVPANENAADEFKHHGKEVEEFFHKCGRDLKALAVVVAGKCKPYWKKAVELFDAYNCGVKAQANRRDDKAVPEPGGQPMEKRQPKPKEEAIGCGCLIVTILVIALFLKGCLSGSGAGKNGEATVEKTQPLALETRSDGSPSDEIIAKFTFFSGFSGRQFKRGTTLNSTGGEIPAGTLLFPVRIEPNPYGGQIRFYFFRDEFDDWKLMVQEGNRKIQIFKQ